jgi:hypothetical protein
VKDGSKTFEVRVNDRGFQMGDEVMLQEWDPRLDESSGETVGYTGAYCGFKIGYVFQLPDNKVVFSLLKLEES